LAAIQEKSGGLVLTVKQENAVFVNASDGGLEDWITLEMPIHIEYLIEDQKAWLQSKLMALVVIAV
jgi:hypothetical protein